MKKTFSIPKMKIELFQKRINKMSKKAEKLGLETFKVEYLDEYIVEQKSATTKDKVYHIPYVNVVVSGEAPQIEGYNLIAMLERLNGENIVKRFNAGTEEESVLSFEELAYRTTECNHCNSNRARKYIMVLQDATNGEIIQVGKACLKDYTNSNFSAEQIASYFDEIDMVAEFEDVTEEELSGGGYYHTLFNLDEIIAISIEFTEGKGYKPSSDALSTKQEVSNFIFHKNLDKYRDMPQAYELVEKHISKIQEVKEYFTTKETDNDYSHNLKVILKTKMTEYKNFGYIVSAYSSYLKAMGSVGTDYEAMKREREAEKAQREIDHLANLQSMYVGEVGQRTTFELTSDKVVSYDGAYGTSYMYFFKDSENNVFLWGTTKDIDLEKGETVSLVGTIKEHKEYRDIKQTVITRCKFN